MMSERQALLYNAENWKDGLSLILMPDDSYQLRKMVSKLKHFSVEEFKQILEECKKQMDARTPAHAFVHSVTHRVNKTIYEHENPPQTEFTKTCSNCGHEFKHAIPHPWHYIDEKGWQFFCSRECWLAPSAADIRRMIIERGENDTEKWS